MSEYIIEEVLEDDIPRAELSEFVEAEEIPIVEDEDYDFDGDSIADTDYKVSEDDSEEEEIKQKLKRAASAPKKPRKVKKARQKSGATEKLQSILLRKFMNEEISYTEYASRMSEMSFDDVPDDEQSVDSDDETVAKKIKSRSKQHNEKDETHHAKKSKRALSSALQGK